MRIAPRATRLVFLAAVVATLIGAAALDVSARTSGMTRGESEVNFAEVGCQCHNPDPTPTVVPVLEGFPWTFEGGAAYHLNITMIGGPEENPDGNKGGFNLLVTGGTLAPAAGYEEFVAIEGNEATHTPAGDANSRTWSVVWTAPTGSENVAAVLTVQAVNGDNLPNDLDQWNRASFISQASGGPLPENSLGVAEIPITKVGVHYLAYWVGVIAFAVLFVVYGGSFFLFKHGETTATTDHRDRPDGGISGPQEFMDKYGFYVAMVVAMLLVVIAIVRAL